MTLATHTWLTDIFQVYLDHPVDPWFPFFIHSQPKNSLRSKLFTSSLTAWRQVFLLLRLLTMINLLVLREVGLYQETRDVSIRTCLSAKSGRRCFIRRSCRVRHSKSTWLGVSWDTPSHKSHDEFDLFYAGMRWLMLIFILELCGHSLVLIGWVWLPYSLSFFLVLLLSYVIRRLTLQSSSSLRSVCPTTLLCDPRLSTGALPHTLTESRIMSIETRSKTERSERSTQCSLPWWWKSNGEVESDLFSAILDKKIIWIRQQIAIGVCLKAASRFTIAYGRVLKQMLGCVAEPTTRNTLAKDSLDILHSRWIFTEDILVFIKSRPPGRGTDGTNWFGFADRSLSSRH